MEKRYREAAYVICHNGGDIIQPMVVEVGMVLTSAQPQLEEFSTEAEWKARLVELGFDFNRVNTPDPEVGGEEPPAKATRAKRKRAE